MDRLDSYERMPEAMTAYLSNYGWHFSKKMCDWAVSMMTMMPSGSSKPQKITPLKKEELESLMAKHGIKLENDKGYDAVYVVNMAKADYYGRSISNEQQLMMFVKDYIDDPDGYDGLPFTRFYADCIGSGRPIFWEDML